MSFFSYNYLKGINLFDSNRNFKIKYSKVDGLSTSDPVTLNGFKIGRVHKINFNPNNTKELIVDIIIENDVNFSNTSIAELYETGLIGGKAIAIIPDYKNDSIIAKDGDYINGIIKPGLTELVNQILPQVQLQVEAVMKNAEIAFENINNLFDDKTRNVLQKSITDISNLTLNLSNTSSQISNLIESNAYNIDRSLSDIRKTSANLRTITDSIATNNLGEMTKNINNIITNLESVVSNLNSDGTIGKLIKDESIYENLEKTINDLNALINDIKNKPGKYINFSVFGKKIK